MTTKIPNFAHLSIIGEISVEPVPPNKKLHFGSWPYLIVGPTGAGKSSVLYSGTCRRNEKPEISKDQLDGYTQCVNAYKLVNVRWGSERESWRVFLVDTPGFSDSKISEREITDMVRLWLLAKGRRYFEGILFLTPITDPRLGGSKRRTIAMLKALLSQNGSPTPVMFVTTMWDQIHSERTRQRAEANFAQLRLDILQEFVAAGSQITRFANTRDSALHILDSIPHNGIFQFYRRAESGLVSAHLYCDLHERIEGAMQRKTSLQSHLLAPDAQTNAELKSILKSSHAENEVTLAKFVRQLAKFGDIPDGFERAAQDLRKRIASEVVPVGFMQRRLFRRWAKEAQLPEDVDKEEQLPEARLTENVDEADQPVFATAPPHASTVILSPLHPPQPLILKGILRRLITAPKRGGDT